MRTIQTSKPVTESFDGDFSERVKLCDQLIHSAKTIVRILEGTHTDEAEEELSRSFVSIRDLLVHVRDVIGFSEIGPVIAIGEEYLPAFENFNDGVTTMTFAYIAIQGSRFDDVDWAKPKEQCQQLRSAIVSLLDFLAVEYAWTNRTTLPAARSLLQLDRDRRRIGVKNSATESELIESDIPQLSVTAKDLEGVFVATAKTIKNSLLIAKTPIAQMGKNGVPYRWNQREAERHCDTKFTRRKILHIAKRT